MHPVATHWQSLDPLLPSDIDDPEGDRVDVDGGYGISASRRADLTQLSSMWTDDLEHVLAPRVTTPEAMDALLTAWLGQLPAEERHLTKLTWPSRDTAMAPVFLKHGFHAPGAMVIRPAGRSSAPAEDGVRAVRPDDIDAVTDLWMEVVRWDAQFGNLLSRPHAQEMVRAEVERLCTAADPDSLVATDGGQVLAAMVVHPADDADWVQSRTSSTPAAYLSVGSTTPSSRGRGVGERLARAAAERADRAHAATLLNYNLINPLSGPFWHRMGYRPLWLGWRRAHRR